MPPVGRTHASRWDPKGRFQQPRVFSSLKKKKKNPQLLHTDQGSDSTQSDRGPPCAGNEPPEPRGHGGVSTTAPSGSGRSETAPRRMVPKTCRSGKGQTKEAVERSLVARGERAGGTDGWSTASLWGAAMVDTRHWSPVRTHRTHAARREPSCKLTAPGDDDMSTWGH